MNVDQRKLPARLGCDTAPHETPTHPRGRTLSSGSWSRVLEAECPVQQAREGYNQVATGSRGTVLEWEWRETPRRSKGLSSAGLAAFRRGCPFTAFACARG